MRKELYILWFYIALWSLGAICSYRLFTPSPYSRGSRACLRISMLESALTEKIPKPRKSWSRSKGLVEEPVSGGLILRENELPFGKAKSETILGSVVELNQPQLVIFYKILKEKTAVKKELEKLQPTFRDQNAKHRFSERDHTMSRRNAEKTPQVEGGVFKEKKLDVRKSIHSINSSGSAPKRRRLAVDEDTGDTNSRSGEFDDSDDESDGSCDDESDCLGGVSMTIMTQIRSKCSSISMMQDLLRLEYGISASEEAIITRLESGRSGQRRKGKTRKSRANLRIKKHNAAMIERQPGIYLPVDGTILVVDLAQKLDLSPTTIISYLIANEGILVAVGQSVNVEVARRVAVAFGKKVADGPSEEALTTVIPFQSETKVDGTPRSPVVTIMGHVDHGKTTLLDRLRKASVAASEVGGITQSISAFSVPVPSNGEIVNITFIDTPGHAAFSAMRTRGARVTDIVVLVVAADDGVMEQTKECIKAALDAGCPLVIAINKMDKEGVDATHAVAGLLEEGVLIEEFGGETQCAHISAKTGTGMDDLLDKILMQAEIMDLRAPVLAPAVGTVIESRKDKGLGLVVSAIVRRGTLSIGDFILAGQASGRVRRLLSDQGASISYAYPSTPVQIIGLCGEASAGDTVSVVGDEYGAKETVEARERIVKSEKELSNFATAKARAFTMTNYDLPPKEVIKVPVVIKCDSAGSAEAVLSAVESLEQSDDSSICSFSVVHCGVGEVTSSDIASAATFNAKVVTYNVRCPSSVRSAARQSNVAILHFDIIYELIDELSKRISSILTPPLPGVLKGRLLVKKVFRIGKSAKVAGCELQEGRVDLQSPVRVLRSLRQVVHSGSIASMRIAKEDIDEFSAVGKECGISLSNYSDLEEGDIIECFDVLQNDDI